MAAQRNFLLHEIWFLKAALGKQAIPVLQQNAEWAEDRGPFQPTLMLAGQLVLFIKSKKISKWMPTSKISQTNTHMEGFRYQLCSTCANIIKHQVKVPQSWVFLRNKYSRKQWDFFSRACLNFSKKEMCHTHTYNLHPALYRQNLIWRSGLRMLKCIKWGREKNKQCVNPHGAYNSHLGTRMTKQGRWLSSHVDLQVLCELEGTPLSSRNTGTEWKLTTFSLYFKC